MKLTVATDADSDHLNADQLIVEIEREEPLTAATLGLSLTEAKMLLREIQQRLVRAQIARYVDAQRECPCCEARLQVKDRRVVLFKSLFGCVKLRLPRFRPCRCEPSSAKPATPTIAGMRNWVAPELEYAQSCLAADLPFARASAHLGMLLPVDAGNAPSTVRRRTMAIGERLDGEVHGTDRGDHCPPAAEGLSAVDSMGLDCGHVRSCHPESERSFEVAVGRFFGSAPARSLGFVRKMESDEQVRRRIRRRVAEESSAIGRLTVFSDGDERLRRLQLDTLPEVSHILDWVHLTWRLTVLRNILHGQEVVAKIPVQYHDRLSGDLKSLKWRLWNGQRDKALRKLEDFLFVLRLRSLTSKPMVWRMRRLAKTLRGYLHTNADSLPNYGERYRAGQRISTAFVESAVNQLVDKRMSKSQQMRWSHKGAHLLLQVRAETVDRRLSRSFARWYPGFSEGAARVA